MKIIKGLLILAILAAVYELCDRIEFRNDYVYKEQRVLPQCEGKSRLDCHYPRYKTLKDLEEENKQ